MDFKAQIDRLCQSNWCKWKRQIVLLLKHHGVWDVVCGEKTCVKESVVKKEWEKFNQEDSLGQLILVSHMDDHHVHLTATCKSSLEI